MMIKEMKSGLYLIPTPIGNLGDITLRAIDTLKAMDRVFCEDTRISQKLLHHYGIKVCLGTYHDHNALYKREHILNAIEAGEKVGLISDAGTPLIADPGYKLTQACYGRGFFVTALPGASALTTALLLSAQPTDRFAFLGFLNTTTHLLFHSLDMTLLFYEAPHRLVASLTWLQKSFHGRTVSVVREVSKLYEQVIRGSYDAVLAHFDNHPPRGEIVIVLSPPCLASDTDMTHDIEASLRQALQTHRVKDATTMVAETFSRPKKEIYQLALRLMEKEMLK